MSFTVCDVVRSCRGMEGLFLAVLVITILTLLRSVSAVISENVSSPHELNINYARLTAISEILVILVVVIG